MTPHLPGSPPVLDAGAFVVRGFEHADVPLVIEASADPLIPLVADVPVPAGAAEAQAFIDRQRRHPHDLGGYSLVIADRAGGSGLGSVGLWTRDLDRGRSSVGYWVLASARGRGAASSALRAVCRWALDTLGIARLELYVEPWNTPSVRTAEACGFSHEGVLRSFEEVDGERRDMSVYSIVRDDHP